MMMFILELDDSVKCSMSRWETVF